MFGFKKTSNLPPDAKSESSALTSTGNSAEAKTEDCLKAGDKLQDRWHIKMKLTSPQEDPGVRYATYLAFDTRLTELVTIKSDPKWLAGKQQQPGNAKSAPGPASASSGSTKHQNKEPSLAAEHEILAKIKSGDLEAYEPEINKTRGIGHQHIVGLIEAGREPSFGFLATTRIPGPTLDEVRKMAPDGRFTLNTTLMLVDQIVTAIHTVHRAGYVHRNIHPGQFSFGAMPSVAKMDLGSHTLFLTDLTTVAKKSNAPKLHQGNFKSMQKFKQNRRYASRHMHKDSTVKVGQIDDLWPVFYMMVEMLGGQLPWTDETKVSAIREQKRYKTLLKTAMKEGWNMHHLRKLVVYLNEVDTSDKLDYDYIRKVLSVNGEDDENYFGMGYLFRYDWELPDHGFTFPDEVDEAGDDTATSSTRDQRVVPDDESTREQ